MGFNSGFKGLISTISSKCIT